MCAMLIIEFPLNFEFSQYSEVIHGSTSFKLTKGLQWLKKNDQPFNLIFLLFCFLHSNAPDNNVINRSGSCYFYMHQNSSTCADLRMCDCMHHIDKTSEHDINGIFNVKYLLKLSASPLSQNNC